MKEEGEVEVGSVPGVGIVAVTTASGLYSEGVLVANGPFIPTYVSTAVGNRDYIKFRHFCKQLYDQTGSTDHMKIVHGGITRQYLQSKFPIEMDPHVFIIVTFIIGNKVTDDSTLLELARMAGVSVRQLEKLVIATLEAKDYVGYVKKDHLEGLLLDFQ
ncbi:hypothetical protein Gasu2_33590 [Galdieria sulphuraria]|nr:hypothetical protein Gasu2_33590 [Galdieria sulphuraria]